MPTFWDIGKIIPNSTPCPPPSLSGKKKEWLITW